MKILCTFKTYKLKSKPCNFIWNLVFLRISFFLLKLLFINVDCYRLGIIERYNNYIWALLLLLYYNTFHWKNITKLQIHTLHWIFSYFLIFLGSENSNFQVRHEVGYGRKEDTFKLLYDTCLGDAIFHWNMVYVIYRK